MTNFHPRKVAFAISTGYTGHMLRKILCGVVVLGCGSSAPPPSKPTVRNQQQTVATAMASNDHGHCAVAKRFSETALPVPDEKGVLAPTKRFAKVSDMCAAMGRRKEGECLVDGRPAKMYDELDPPEVPRLLFAEVDRKVPELDLDDDDAITCEERAVMHRRSAYLVSFDPELGWASFGKLGTVGFTCTIGQGGQADYEARDETWRRDAAVAFDHESKRTPAMLSFARLTKTGSAKKDVSTDTLRSRLYICSMKDDDALCYGMDIAKRKDAAAAVGASERAEAEITKQVDLRMGEIQQRGAVGDRKAIESEVRMRHQMSQRETLGVSGYDVGYAVDVYQRSVELTALAGNIPSRVKSLEGLHSFAQLEAILSGCARRVGE